MGSRQYQLGVSSHQLAKSLQQKFGLFNVLDDSQPNNGVEHLLLWQFFHEPMLGMAPASQIQRGVAYVHAAVLQRIAQVGQLPRPASKIEHTTTQEISNRLHASPPQEWREQPLGTLISHQSLLGRGRTTVLLSDISPTVSTPVPLGRRPRGCPRRPHSPQPPWRGRRPAPASRRWNRRRLRQHRPVSRIASSSRGPRARGLAVIREPPDVLSRLDSRAVNLDSSRARKTDSAQGNPRRAWIFVIRAGWHPRCNAGSRQAGGRTTRGRRSRRGG